MPDGSTERDALLQVIDALDTLGIQYMVVGSFASTFWGRPRTTHDVDLVVEIRPTDAAPLARLLASAFYAPDFVIEEAARKRDRRNIQPSDVDQQARGRHTEQTSVVSVGVRA